MLKFFLEKERLPLLLFCVSSSLYFPVGAKDRNLAFVLAAQALCCLNENIFGQGLIPGFSSFYYPAGLSN